MRARLKTVRLYVPVACFAPSRGFYANDFDLKNLGLVRFIAPVLSASISKIAIFSEGKAS